MILSKSMFLSWFAIPINSPIGEISQEEPSIPSETFPRKSRSLGRFRSSRLPPPSEYVMSRSERSLHVPVTYTLLLY